MENLEVILRKYGFTIQTRGKVIVIKQDFLSHTFGFLLFVIASVFGWVMGGREEMIDQGSFSDNFLQASSASSLDFIINILVWMMLGFITLGLLYQPYAILKKGIFLLRIDGEKVKIRQLNQIGTWLTQDMQSLKIDRRNHLLYALDKTNSKIPLLKLESENDTVSQDLREAKNAISKILKIGEFQQKSI